MKNFSHSKRSSLKLLVAFSIVASGLVFSSCGSIFSAFSGGERPVYVVNAPKDLVVTQDGIEQDISLEVFASQEGYGVSTTFYTSAVKLPYKKDLTLKLSSGGKSNTIDLESKRWKSIFWCNLFTFPIVGHIIDFSSRNNKVLKPRYIDVTSLLNNVPIKDWPSKKKLKKMEKKKIKKANK